MSVCDLLNIYNLVSTLLQLQLKLDAVCLSIQQELSELYFNVCWSIDVVYLVLSAICKYILKGLFKLTAFDN